MVHVAILGCTGSIGTQALDVIASHPDRFVVEVLSAHNNADALISLSKKFTPNAVVIGDGSKLEAVKSELFPLGIKVYGGEESLSQVVAMEEIDVVLTAMMGAAGLKPTISAINAGKHIALANKETLVVAGELVTKLAREKSVNIYPVDSEHSAIFQCMAGEWQNPIEKIFLTASGGPFRGMKKDQLENVTPQQALKHPNWNMGAKITIDSASMMNKGLEVIEAQWLFHLKPDQIEVVVHPQSIIHSMVQFRDGSIKAQMGLPDMRLPIQYALGFPHRIAADFERLDFAKHATLTFESVDRSSFPCLDLAYHAMEKGGVFPCALNAANEIAVGLFLNGNIKFTRIPGIIEHVIENTVKIDLPALDDYLAVDAETRTRVLEMYN